MPDPPLDSENVTKPAVNIVWLKRDLRFTDHEPLLLAQKHDLPLLLFYFFEPSVMNYPDSDVRHWRFVYESIQEMQERLEGLQAQIYVFHNEVLPVLAEVMNVFDIKNIFSHQEIGNRLTYDRDLSVADFCSSKNIIWHEFQHNGVVRKLKSRKNWQALWQQTMTANPCIVEEENWLFATIPDAFYQQFKGETLPKNITERNKNFQPGGESYAWKYLKSFLEQRYHNYSKHISKPALSRTGCSRISPYLSYGNISMRMVYQYTMQHYAKAQHKMALQNFISRLHWHCHFMQKFEDECRMEFQNVNAAFDILNKPRNSDYILAWQTGNTGVPIVDACMRCLHETGYINFRMRALVVSFFVFNLWQDWRELHFLAKLFLDYEPGIHYPQLQMQAGVTGVNIIRIYNPIKNSIAHDPEAVFIKKWLPELHYIPAGQVHEPWLLSEMEQSLFKVKIGKDYPFPIVDIEETRRNASKIIWDFRKKEETQQEAKRILKKHVNRPKMK
ncbi:MAG: deoxyribodipyrimidine photo-lyase [Pseudarcicella sp.]|nr:deoxyribodipyrimidine photo-lyase [Pseudarcicella sp.]